MKKFIRLMSALLTAMMLLSGLAGLSVIEISATSTKKEEEVTTEDLLKKYLTTEYKTPEDKLATMKLMRELDGYQLWVDEMSGEVATVNLASGQILFSNPYDISTTKGSDSTKEQIMSQIAVRYVDNDTEKTFYSFVEAGYRGQIKVKNIKSGIRVEYTIGREETRMLVPRYIKKDRFEEVILNVAQEQLGPENFTFKKLSAYYLEKDPEKLTSERAKAELYAAFPITKKMAIYVFDPTASETELRRIEEIIKTYCPLYTYEELDKDHEMTEYVGSDRAPALFKMALEYTLDADGMSVRLPANGIRFDESEYQLTYISILPYMGAGANYAGSDKTKTQTGYTFYPDGSGSIFRFEELANLGTTTISGKVYGYDFAYHSITGSHQETIRYPAFGLVANDITTEYVRVEEDGKTSLKEEEVEVGRGYVAVIEEGDAMAEIYTYHAGSLSKYNTVQMMFYPRPKDSYNMKDAISVGTNSTWTVVSARKYVGNYKIRYFMLTDAELAAKKEMESFYDASWIGMSVAYREYLDKTGMLERLTAADVKKDIPLYIETFGSVETVEKILSIPVNTKVALTSFENIKTMYDELAADEITNINFKLTGYANGGMYSTMPYKLKWEKSVGGKNGFEELVEYSEEKDFGVYPDFDFVYSQRSGAFDGLNSKKHFLKTIDNRYTSRREYSATYQTFVSYFQIAISPAYYNHFYEKFTTNYLKTGSASISVSTLGSDLNSDFDEDEPYNREDSKEFTIDAFEYLDKNYDSIMVTGGNAYTWKYIDHILGVSLDSSRYNKSSNSVPFLGVLLHGYIQFAGTALNMEGNVGYAMLRTIENGAAPYFILSYDNTTLLKEDYYLSKYYSVRYDIWYDELVEIYKELNSVLADVQTKLIIDHEFLVGERVPDEDELAADIIAAQKALKEELEKAQVTAATQAIRDILSARQTAKNNAAKIDELLASAKTCADDAKASIAAIETALLAMPAVRTELDAATAAEEAALAVYDAAKATAKEAKAAYDAARTGTDTAATEAAKAVSDAAAKAETEANTAYKATQTATKTAKTNFDKADKELATALSAGTTASNTAKEAAETADKLAKDARVAAEFLAKIEGATDAIKKAAAEYADSAEKNCEETKKYSEQATDNAAVAIAISADRTIASLISTAESAATSAATRAEDVTLKYENVLKAETTVKETAEAKETALKTYEEAQDAYAKATAAAALPTATEADKVAATEAGTAMNAAKTEYSAANTAATRAESSLISAKTALKNSLQKVLDERVKAENAAEETNNALAAAKDAVEALKTVEGMSDVLKNAASESYEAAATAAADINKAVDAAKATYVAAAEVAKEYVVLEEPKKEEPEPEPEVPAETPAEGDEQDPAVTPETPDEGDAAESGSQLYADYEYTKYTNDNGNIVKVTYGDIGPDGKYVVYKTFILNYNFFDVTVVVDGVTYTIPQSGYVVFYQ